MLSISALKRKQKKVRARVRALAAVNPSSHSLVLLKASLSSINDEIKAKLNSDREISEIKAIAQIKKNPSFFYSYARKFSKLKCKVGPLKNQAGQFISDPKDLADLLQTQFCSVFSNPESSATKDPCFPPVETSLEDIILTIEDIISAIDALKQSSAPGEDEFPAILLKNCKLTLALPLFLMWDYSFQNSRIESCNLSSIAAPIFKVESNLKPLNYPPVSLTSHIITIFKGFSKKGSFILGGQQRILNCQ